MSILTNRYSLALFLPLTIFMAIYGPQLLAVWISPQFAANCSGVLAALLVSTTITNAGQYSSISILFGMGRHQRFARALVVEALVMIGGVALVARPFGITGVAWVVASAMVLNRGMFTAWLLSHELRVGYFRFLASVYQPLIYTGPAIAVLYALRHTVLPGRNWAELILAGMIALACYAPLALMTLRSGSSRAVMGEGSRALFKVIV